MSAVPQKRGGADHSRPNPKAAPTEPDPQAPLNPAWPDVSPQNGWCLPREVFIPHMDRVLRSLGVPVESRTSMITSWLPSLMRHKNIASQVNESRRRC